MEIFDWETHSKQIYESKSFATRNKQYVEHINLFKFMRKQGFQKNEIIDFLKDTDSIYYNSCNWEDTVEDIWKKSLVGERVVGITQKELNFINSLEVDVVTKRYYIFLLCYCRYLGGKQDSFEWKNKIQSFGIRKALGGNRARPENSTKIDSNNRNVGFYKKKDTQIKTKGSFQMIVECELLHKDNEGEIVYTIPNLETVDILWKFVTSICKVCGKQFTIYPHSKRLMCKDCYKEYRYLELHKDIIRNYNSKIQKFKDFV